MNEIEGYVLRFEDDFSMFKIKTDWYKKISSSNMNKYLFGELNEIEIYQMIIDNSIDDMISMMSENETRREIEDYNILFWKKMNIKYLEGNFVINGSGEYYKRGVDERE
jgi:hypothetical protein